MCAHLRECAAKPTFQFYFIGMMGILDLIANLDR
jgi:hypothetical protein